MPDAALSTRSRDAVLDRLEREMFDCAVIGGGIAGAGIARSATDRGLRVALLEAEDYAAGTSSRSTKLIHGGLRYLAMGDVGLVRTTALERKEIFRIAPHLAERRWMVVPARSWPRILKMRAAITTYEKLGEVAGPDLHRNWSTEEIARHEPCLDRTVYKQVCAYREYLTDDAHLVLANLRAAAAGGAAVLNHARVDEIPQQGGRAAGVEAVCGFSGRRVHVRARCVINAAGPWVEAVRRLEDAAAPPLLHLSKGIHIVLPAERLPVNEIVLCNTNDRRSIFVIRHGDCVYVGTTDTSYAADGDGLWPEITRADVEYLLEPLGRYFDVDPLRPDDVIGAWAGLRPLIAQPGKPPTEISRRDEVLVGRGRVITIAGGKLTGYRLMAHETVEKAAEVCGLSPAPPPAQDAPLPGGDFDGELQPLEAALVKDFGVSAACAARMLRLYGTEARDIAERGAEPLIAGAPVLASEVDWAIDFEGAATLEDVIYRRLRTAWYVPEARVPGLEPIATRMAARLGWDEERRRRELAAAGARLAADLAFQSEGRPEAV